MPTIALIRHGETDLNRARIMQPPQTPLSALGRAQAAAVGPRVAALRPAALVASDLARAWETGQYVSAACGLPAAPHALLHERNFGDWRGQPYTALGFDPVRGGHVPPNGESVEAFDARVDAAWLWLLAAQRDCGGLLVAVTHGLLIAGVLARHVRLPAGLAPPGHLGNTSLTLIDAAAPHQARLLDCTEHLAGLEATGGPGSGPA
ncbi:MAG: histidine phosphatase family protein [Aquabacterium sp.]